MTQQQLDTRYERIAAKAAALGALGWFDASVRRELRALWRAEDSFGAYAELTSEVSA